MIHRTLLSMLLLTTALGAQELSQPGNTVLSSLARTDAAGGPLTIRAQLQLEIPSTIAISPDGSRVLYSIRKPSLSENRWITQLYLLDLKEKSGRPLTVSAASAGNPSFSPDGKWVTFTSARPYLNAEMAEQKGTSQLFAIPVDGGEALPLTSLPNGVDEFSWAPDGSSIAILTEGEAPKQAQSGALKNDGVSSADPKAPKELWILRMSDRFARRIAEVDRGVAEIEMSPDGKTIAYQTNYTGEYNDEQKYDIWSITIDGVQTQLTRSAGPETKPRFSPDGKKIAFITQTLPDIEFAETDLSVMDADGGNVRNLTKDFDFSVTDFAWEAAGGSLILAVDRRTSSPLYRLDPAKGDMAELTKGEGVYSSLSVAQKTGTVCAGFETGSSLREIVTIEKGKQSALTGFSDQLRAYQHGSVELIDWPARDGKFTIEGLLVKPPGYDPAKRYPLILFLHGGPYGQFKNTLIQVYAIHQYATAGYLCLLPNVRGGSGYGDAFSQSNRYDLGGGDYQDAMAGVDHLIAMGIVDSARMGVTGGSYGGYLTNWVISQTPRFKAAVSMYGIFSWLTDWSNSFQPSFEQMYFGYNYWDRPLDGKNLYIARAPQSFVKNIVTPTLILQGTEDQYTNISNSREMYQALKELGRTVEFVTYRGEGHGLRGKPNNYINSVERAAAWFDRFLTGKK